MLQSPPVMPRIGVAGIGIVSPLGLALDEVWQRLMAGDGAIERLSFEGLPDIAAAQVHADIPHGLSKLQQVGTERVSLFALGGVRQAMADAGISSWEAEAIDAERVGLYLGTGMGGAATVDAGYAALHAGRRVPPLTVPAGMVNNAAAVIALHAAIHGPVLTYAVACASSAIAIAEAAHALRRGEIDVAVAGGVEALLARGTVAAWQALRTLSTPDRRQMTQQQPRHRGRRRPPSSRPAGRARGQRRPAFPPPGGRHRGTPALRHAPGSQAVPCAATPRT